MASIQKNDDMVGTCNIPHVSRHFSDYFSSPVFRFFNYIQQVTLYINKTSDNTEVFCKYEQQDTIGHEMAEKGYSKKECV